MSQTGPSKIAVALRSRSGKNALFSAAGAAANPLVQLAAMPILFKGLGVDSFGIWILIYSVLAISGVATFGLGDAATKYVAVYRARGDTGRVLLVVRVAVVLFLVLATIAGAILWMAAPALVESVFKVRVDDIAAATAAFRIASFGLVFRLVYAVFEASLRGHDRYDIDAVWGALGNAGSTVAAAGLVLAGHGLEAVLAVSVGILGLTAVRLAFALRGVMGTWNFLVPSADRATVLELGGFAVFTWMQSVSGILYQQADRILVGSLAGAAAAGVYSVCLQLVLTGQTVLSRSSAFVYPLLARTFEAGDEAGVWGIFRRAMTWTTVSGGAFALVLLGGGRELLALWMGPDFAATGSPVLSLLAIWVAVAATGIIPFFALNASGGERINTAAAAGSLGVFVALGWWLVPVAGTAGAALARVGSAVGALPARLLLFRHLFPPTGRGAGLMTLVPPVLAVAPFAGMFWAGARDLGLWERFGLAGAGFILLGVSTLLVYRRLGRSIASASLAAEARA